MFAELKLWERTRIRIEIPFFRSTVQTSAHLKSGIHCKQNERRSNIEQFSEFNFFVIRKTFGLQTSCSMEFE